MDLNSRNIQLQYQGFVNTPLLWKSDIIFGLKQFKLQETDAVSFNESVQKNLRLGKRVERFTSYLFKQHEEINVLAENVQIQNKKTTIGELDCILEKNDQPIHLEIVYKFYLYDNTVGSTELAHWVGPNKNDNLFKKLTKLKEKQLPLLFKPQTKSLLKKLGLIGANILQQVYFKAQLFLPFNFNLNIYTLVNKECITGFYIRHDELPQFKNCKFFIPSKVNWLQEVQTQTSWLNFEQFSSKLEPIIQNKTSPLCWIKYPNGEVQKFFVVWWD